VTLTYSDEHLPEDGGLIKADLQKFHKRLRKEMGPFRYYACGEYGDETLRAHYHSCIFGLDFQDKIHFRRIGEHNLYISPTLNRIWGLGHTTIGALTFETAAYTARYVTKKLHGSKNRYVRLDETTGELIPLLQPFAAISNGGGKNSTWKGGLGATWLRQYHQDIYNINKDSVIIRGRKIRPPKYYDKIYDTINPTKLESIKENRLANHDLITPEELRARETITRARIIHRTQV
jgi:hypothetical protein